MYNTDKELSLFILLSILFILLEFSSCAPFTDVKMESIKKQPSFLKLMAKPQEYRGQKVFLGGTVAAVNKKRGKTYMEIIELPVDDSGRPLIDYPSEGRFIAEVSHDMDPTLFGEGTPVTVRGNVIGKAQGLISESFFPLVQVKTIIPWKESIVYGKNSTNWFDQPEGNLHAWGWGPGAYWW
ncbi:Slp family lipoprotein [Candidatus Methylacidiphilum infernorum]|uniref:Slp family lipoprotein n=1 Tax=Candidatus Methylacidiphilum infernorum TaxID=511746 RepID=A0ABX7PX30_9BACT|nr:Slp family lipoprotein [Candidatus Methylacidiphilum infernorum]QSR87283.1 Slp family lipoprotein [Candidatus Methylacidiphilum infernorum]